MKINPLFKYISKIIVLFISGLAFITLLSAIIFSLYRNQISEQILNRTNGFIQGEMQFDRVSISPFKRFPTLAISLNNVKYFETKTDSLFNNLPIATIDHIYLSFDFDDLMNKKITIDKVLLSKGTINLKKYSDSTINIVKGSTLIKQRKRQDTTTNKTIKQTDTKKASTDTTIQNSISAFFDEIAMDEISVFYTDEQKQNTSNYFIETLNASVQWKKDSIQVFLHLNGDVISQSINQLNITNQKIKLNAETIISKNEGKITFQNTNVTIDHSTLNAFGIINYKSTNLTSDINFTSNDINLNIIHLLLPKDNHYVLDSGNIHFEGSIKGSLLNSLPQIKATYKVNNASVLFLNSNKRINKINFDGFFDSGSKSDFSEALLKIDTINAKLPNGYIHGSFFAKNWVNPTTDYKLAIDVDLAELNHFVDSSIITDMNGKLTIESEFKGNFNTIANNIEQIQSYNHIDFNQVNLHFKDILSIQHLNGSASGNINDICLDNINAIIGNSDFNINATITNLSALISKNNKPITGQFNLSSHRIDLAELFHNRPNIGESFSYQISNINLETQATTSYTELTQMPVVPRIEFDIKHLKASIEKMLPEININKGNFTLDNKDSALYLDFKNIEAEICNGKIVTDLVFKAPQKKESNLSIHAKINNINPGKIFQKNSDSISAVLNSNLSGEIKGYFDISPNKNKLFHYSSLNINKFSYTGIIDTFTIDELYIDADTIQYNSKEHNNPLASLRSTINLSLKSLKRRDLTLQNLSFNISANAGEFNIVPNNSDWMGTKGIGLYTINPFKTPATYEINYEVNQFESIKLLQNFTKDTFMLGLLDLKLHLLFQGLTKEEILASLNGDFQLKGNNLVYRGINIDALIEKLKRSQRFSLVDVGAMMVAGPVGLALTKGSDYSRLLINNGDATKINELYTYWKIQDGKFITNDLGLSTDKNRCAALGWINPINDSLNLSIAVLNPNGCSIMSQKVSGTLSKPKINELKIFTSLIAPVTNLFDDVFSTDCEPFYKGQVKHPISKNKANNTTQGSK